MAFKLLKALAISCAVVVLVVPDAARATTLGTVDISYTGRGAYDNVFVWVADTQGVGTNAGLVMLEKSGGTGQGNIWPDGPLGSFCIEWVEAVSSDTLTYDVIMPEEGPLPTDFLGGPMGASKAEYLAELWGRYFDPAWLGVGSHTDEQNVGAQAFAVAVWEITHEDLPSSPMRWDARFDGTDGDRGFSTWGDGAAIANDWLHSLDGTGPMAELRVFSYLGQQDYIVEIPEPGTIVLLGFGGVLSLLRRKRAVI